MALKDILVHVDGTPSATARIRAAMSLAAHHDAHLIGLATVTPIHIPSHLRTLLDEEVVDSHLQAAHAAAERWRASFEEEARLAGVRSEWRCVEGALINTFVQNARYVDVAILGQRDPSGLVASDDAAIPDQVILSVGCPVLVVPYAGTFETVGRRVMVAWDASRLATRAVGAAMPVLTMAKHVQVVSINPNGSDDEKGEGPLPSADLCLHLARHGINAEARTVYADDLGAGDMLLSLAADNSIDLLVMGAYGHARWREIVLGGVTRYMLNHMTLPVLMTH